MPAFLLPLSRSAQRLRLLIPIICGHLCLALLLWMPAKAEATAMSVHNIRCVSVKKRVSWKVHQWCSYGAGIGGCQLSMSLTKKGKRFDTSLRLSSNDPVFGKTFNARYFMRFNRKKGRVHFRYWEGKTKVGGFLLRRINKKKNLWVLQSRFRHKGAWSRLKPFHFDRRLVVRCAF